MVEEVQPKQPNCLQNLKTCKASCCRTLVFREKVIPEHFKEYYKIHGCKVEQLKDRTYRLIIPMKCPHLDKDNKCDIQESKPLLCRRLTENTKHQYYLTEGCIL